MNDFTIKRLSDNVINQIKAGEVIERPLNVVKELVENAIDASSKKISIELLDGGKKLIQVSDNGIGIAPEQIQFATERHTTSKLQSIEDLYSLKSFGFRGEALASILSVSQFSIKSKIENNLLGTEMIFHANQRMQREVAMNTGTTITVKELFFNVPARLKFLRSTATEFALITEFLQAISLAEPHLSFEFTHNGRKVFHYRAQSTLKERFAEIMQLDADNYVEVNFTHGNFKINGFAILPEKIKSAQNTITMFVNQRYVKDRFVRSSIYSGYQGLLMKGIKPSATLFITMDPHIVDINAHPSKIEVRFFDPLMVQDLIARSIENAVKANIHLSLCPIGENIKNTPSQEIFADIARNHIQTIPQPIHALPLFSELQANHPFSNILFLGQFLKCYLFFEKQTDLWIVDQHAFHERILFEELQTAFKSNGVQKQYFLNPSIFPTDPVFQHVYEENKEFILNLGFQIEILKNQHLAIHSVPSFLNERSIEPLFREISEKLSQQKRISASDLYHDCFATIACHSAIRSGEELSAGFVEKLVNRSKDVDFFQHCPHGRPVIRKFSKNDVERWFERI